MAETWTSDENEAAISEYFSMLELELDHSPYNKAEHNRRLVSRLGRRTRAAVERKHQNISAVLREFGWPAIDGYAPLGNYQYSLLDMVVERIRNSPELSARIARAVDQTPAQPELDDILSTLVPAPRPVSRLSAPTEDLVRDRARGAPVIDYIAREAANRALGDAGERFVVRFEKARLQAAGQSNLIGSLERVSVSRGDGEGYDIRSFDESGRERFIEVKTTRFGSRTPFYVTRNELLVSREYRAQYHVYRLFAFYDDVRLYQVPGAIDSGFLLAPHAYRAAPH